MSDRLDEVRAVLTAMRAKRAEEAKRSPLTLWSQEAERIAARQVQETIDEAGRHVSNQWKAQALEAARRVALARDTFTVLDVRAELGDDHVEPYDPRAFGSIMQAMARRGWAQSTGDYVVGPAWTHSRPLRVWRSLLRSSSRSA